MPKPRLSRQLFGTYTVALVIVLASCYWLSTVRIAAVTEEAEFKRMVSIAVGLADFLREVVDPSQEEQMNFWSIIQRKEMIAGFQEVDF